MEVRLFSQSDAQYRKAGLPLHDHVSPFVSVFCLPFALAFPFSCEKAEEAVSPKAQMTMNTGNFLSNVEIFIISPFIFAIDSVCELLSEHQACQTITVNNPRVKTGGC